MTGNFTFIMAGPTGIEPMAYCLGMNIIYPFGIVTLTPNNILKCIFTDICIYNTYYGKSAKICRCI